MTLRVGLIGDPVAHSLSPKLHNAAFRHFGIAANYELWPTSAEALPERVDQLRAPQTLGANVTLPHKVQVIPLLDQVDPQAQAIGAVNTIIRTPDGSLSGVNTDAPAFLAALRTDAEYDPSGQTVVILGASGAARAAVVALLGADAKSIVVINRTLDKAEALLADVLASSERDPELIAVAANDPDVPSFVQSATLIVNATSLGWHGDATPLTAQFIPSSALVFDMVYRPTRLLREASAKGARTLDGLGMLVRQAALAFEHWTGKAVPLEVMYEAVGR